MKDVWGRLVSHFESGRYTGVALILEAQPYQTSVTWPKSLKPDGRKELDRLEADGHQVTFEKSEIKVAMTLESCRNTQLYRTLPHELGHAVHYNELDDTERWKTLPAAEKEQYSHRYADEKRHEMEKRNWIPFDRILVGESLGRDGLQRKWFE